MSAGSNFLAELWSDVPPSKLAEPVKALEVSRRKTMRAGGEERVRKLSTVRCWLVLTRVMSLPALCLCSAAAAQDKWQLLPAFLQLRGLVKQHIDSYNYFIQVELKQILMANQKVQCDVDPNFFLKYTDIRVGTPSVEEELIISKTTPNVSSTRGRQMQTDGCGESGCIVYAVGTLGIGPAQGRRKRCARTRL